MPDDDRRNLRIAGGAAVVGQVLLLLASAAHPSHEHPGNHPAVFGEYAASSSWTTVHLVQWLGGMLTFVAMAALALHVIRRAKDGVPAAKAALAAVVTVAGLFTVLQAVDGVALKMAVDGWHAADNSQRAAAFSAAEAIRWVEIGLNAFARIMQGAAVGLVAFTAMKAGVTGRVAGTLGVVGGIGGVAGALATAHTGFSTFAAAVGMGPWLAQTIWLFVIGARMLRQARSPRSLRGARRTSAIAVLIAAFAMTACTTAPPTAGPRTPQSPVTVEQARTMAEQMLVAYNAGDYATYSADWSTAMKDAIGPDAFAAFRSQAMGLVGDFVEITGAELKPGEKDPNVSRHEFIARFVKDDRVQFVIAFEPGDTLVDGAHFDPSV